MAPSAGSSCSPRSTARSPSSAKPKWRHLQSGRSSRTSTAEPGHHQHCRRVTLKLTCRAHPGQNTIVRGSKAVSQGVEVCKDFRILGVRPVPVAGSADITSLYTARYGAPKAGTKVYVQVNQAVDGWESLPRTFSAIVPAS